ncbi:hypothetical protein ACRPK2_05895 [Lactococcus garvieae]|uniref:hypothetical protein n=1 Tax=Lactococcus garvieae TaxID=1363 RepID=UPI003D77EE65
MFKEGIENDILNMIIIIILGGLGLSILGIFLKVFKIEIGKILKSKFNQILLFMIFMEVIGATLVLLIDYGASFMRHGNFLIPSLLDSFLSFFGYSFQATPMMNVMLTVLPFIVGMFMMYFFFPYIFTLFVKQAKEDINLWYNKENKEVICVVKGRQSTRIDIQYFKIGVLLGVFLVTTLQLWLFNLYIYPQLLPRSIQVFALGSTLVTLLLSIIFIGELRRQAISCLVQNLFEDENHRDLLKIFEVIITRGSLKLKGEDFFEELRNYIEMNMIKIFPQTSVNHLELEKNYKLEIPRQIKEVFESEREFRHRIT